MNNLQPYQKASMAQKNRGENALKLGAGALAAQAALPRVLPLLSNYIPTDLAMKGLKKVAPGIGDFMENTLNVGFGADEVKEFVKGKMSAGMPKEGSNIIQQVSDQLYEFLQNHIKQGRNPLEAGALAQLDPKFKNDISKLEKQHKTPWSAILQTVFGGQEQPQRQAEQPIQSPSNNDEAIMAALQKVLNM
jgi:hypothetical protein